MWQEEGSPGRFGWDRVTGASHGGSARVSGARNGCFIQSSEVKPGEWYAVSVLARWQGRAEPWVRVRWQTPEGKWSQERRDVMVFAGSRDEDPAPAGWHGLFGSVEVPEGVGRLVLLPGATGQSPEDTAWFDDAHVYRLR